jgi:hypothetical protein
LEFKQAHSAICRKIFRVLLFEIADARIVGHLKIMVGVIFLITVLVFTEHFFHSASIATLSLATAFNFNDALCWILNGYGSESTQNHKFKLLSLKTIKRNHKSFRLY